MVEQRVCKMHGGMAPQVLAAAERRQQLAAARQAVETYGLPREISPESALLEEVHRTAGHVAWLGSVVAGLKEGDVVWGVAESVAKGSGEFPGTDVTHKAAVNVWVDLYLRERKHLTDVCARTIAAGVEKRRVKLAEEQGSLLAGVIRAVLGDLDLTAEQQAKVPEVASRHLRAVAELEQAGGAA